MIYSERDFPPVASDVHKVLAIVSVPVLAELQRELPIMKPEEPEKEVAD